MKTFMYFSALLLLLVSCDQELSESLSSSTEAVEIPERLSYQELRERFVNSNLVLKNGFIIRVDNSTQPALNESREMEAAQKAYQLTVGRVAIPEGAKVIVREVGTNTVVTFENQKLSPEPQTRGGEFAAEVIFDSDTGTLIRIVRSG